MLLIINFIKKYWILFAIVVLYFILAGLNFLPRGLNIFKKQELLIDDTPVIVKEIRELGELTTSEFYGEVYADLNEVYEDLVATLTDSIIINPALYYQNYKGLKEYMDNSGRYQEMENAYFSASERYDTMLSEYLKKVEEFKQDESKLNEEIEANKDNRKERKQLEKRLDDLKDKLKEEKGKLDNEREDFRKIEKKYREKRVDIWELRKRRNLVYIGRGWVKAGVSLKDLTDDDIIVDEDDSSSIQIRISDPVIIDADINPWFIYTDEKKVKGFEVFIEKTGSILSEDNFTDREVADLKRKCKDKLKENAIEKGLLTNAKSSAINTLENFFHLVGFKKVSVRFKSDTKLVIKNN